MRGRVPMRLIGLSVVGLACCAYFADFLLSVRAQENARIVADSTDHDFGAAPPVEMKHSFLLTNRSESNIEITDVLKTCGCTTIVLPDKPLGPHESVPVTATLDGRGRHGPFSSRFQVIYKRVGAPKKAEKVLTFTLSADVNPVVIVTPQELEFTRGLPATKRLAISSTREPDVTTRSVRCDHEAFSAEVVEGGRGVEVSFDPSRWREASDSTSLHVETSSTAEKQVHVNVRVVPPGAETKPAAASQPGPGR